ncbi:MAG: hypothetical protein QG664_902 [Patescibacteria group bacterium]|nr:hypothetical protein [Patescibacteria group bacterium]
MTWILVSIISYFFGAVAALLDKVLLSGRIGHPSVYAFFVSLFSLFALLFIPFGFQWYGSVPTLVFLVSGMLFLYGLLALYAAVQKSEISRVAPLVGTIMALTALFVYFFPIGGDMGRIMTITWVQFLAFALLVGGGILITIDFPLRTEEQISPLAVVAGISMAVSLLLLKYGYHQYDANFESGFVWSRIGMFLGGVSLFLIPRFRRQILSGLRSHGVASSRNTKTGILFLANKVSGGTAAFLMNYATYLGPVTFIQALSGIQFVFLLMLAWVTSTQYPHIFEERFGVVQWVQKGVAVGLIICGMWLSVMSGARLLIY